MGQVLLTRRDGLGTLSIAGAAVTLGPQPVYNGQAQRQAVEQVLLGGQVLQEGADYAVVGQPGVNAGTYQLTVAGILGYGGAVEAAWSIGRAQGQVALDSQSVTLSPDQAEGVQVAVEAVGDGAVSAQSQDTGVALAQVQQGVLVVTPVGVGETTVVVSMAQGTNYTAAQCALQVKVAWSAQVYGLVWDYQQGGDPVRMAPEDDPLGYVNAQIAGQPVAAVGEGAGQSPCDQLAPWKDMVRYNLGAEGQVSAWTSYAQDTLVWIPPFYALVKKDQEAHKLYMYLADGPRTGLSLHPGSGRYVARYALGEGAVNSTGADPAWGENRDWFRQAAADKGAGWAQYDFAAYSAICLLYLVEWARWDSQAAVGKGYVQEGGMPLAAGGTDAMVYHTGRAAGTDGETAVQYRWLENLWGNVAQWVDGFNTQDGQVYVCLDPQQWQDAVAQGYQQAGVVMPGAGWITSFSPGQLGWALLPDQVAAQSDGHVPDYTGRGLGQDGWRGLIVGGMCSDGDKAGLFHFLPDIYPEYGDIFVGGRMQFLPQAQ